MNVVAINSIGSSRRGKLEVDACLDRKCKGTLLRRRCYCSEKNVIALRMEGKLGWLGFPQGGQAKVNVCFDEKCQCA